jgi:hypothetical protein
MQLRTIAKSFMASPLGAILYIGGGIALWLGVISLAYMLSPVLAWIAVAFTWYFAYRRPRY